MTRDNDDETLTMTHINTVTAHQKQVNNKPCLGEIAQYVVLHFSVIFPF